MTRRSLGALIAFTVMVAGASLGLVGLGTPAYANSPVAPAPDVNARGFDQLNACLASREKVDALYVVDVSGSLVGNDPQGRRFEALEASVTQLGLLAGGKQGREVQAAVSTFGDSFVGPRSVQDWTAVGGAATGDVAAAFRSRAEQAWEAAGTSQGTNYEAALEGAQSVLASRGARSKACQVVFWFTDGLFAIGDSYDEAATNAASRRMCQPGGLVDELRKEEVSVIALALSGPDVDAQLAQPQYRARRGELQAMAVGTSRGGRCGTTPVPETSRSGIYLSVDDPVGLGALFSGVAAQAAGCTPETLKVATPAKFRVQPGVNRFQVDISVDGGGAVTVTAPSGASTTQSSGSGRVGDAEVSVSRMGSLATVTVVLDAGGRESSGMWRVHAGSGVRPASITLYRCSDLRLEILPPDAQLSGGEPGVVEAVAVDSAGRPADLTAYQGPSADDPVSVAVTSAPESKAMVSVSDAVGGRLRVELTPPEDTTVVELALELTPRLARAPDIELGNVSAVRRLPVTPPSSFPTVTPVELDLGRAVGLDPSSATLEVVGSGEGPSTVCIGEASSVEAPAESGTNHITASAECLDLDAGESSEVVVSVVPETSVDGSGSATLPVTLVNADGEEIQQEVALGWSLERRIDQGTRMWLVLLAILVSLILLALALFVVNRMLARFAVGDVRFATVPAEIDGEGHVRTLAQVGEVRPEYLYIDKSERTRLDDPSASGISLRATAPRTLGDPEFTAHAPTGARLVPADGVVRGDGSSDPVTAGLGAGWLLQVSDSDLLGGRDDAPTPARLTVYGRGDVDVLQRMTTRCSARVSENGWPQVRAALAERARATSGDRGDAHAVGVDAGDSQPSRQLTDDDDPFGGSGGGSWDEPLAREQPAVSWRDTGRSARRKRSAADETAASHTPLDDEDPFA